MGAHLHEIHEYCLELEHEEHDHDLYLYLFLYPMKVVMEVTELKPVLNVDSSEQMGNHCLTVAVDSGATLKRRVYDLPVHLYS